MNGVKSFQHMYEKLNNLDKIFDNFDEKLARQRFWKRKKIKWKFGNKKLNQIKILMESITNRLDQEEDRISEIEDKVGGFLFSNKRRIMTKSFKISGTQLRDQTYESVV